MSFCITIKNNGQDIATSFYSEYIKYEHYQIVDEAIECMNRYNQFIGTYKSETELVIHMLNTRENMELCGYKYDMCGPIFDKISDDIIKKSFPSFKRNENNDDYRIISIVEDEMENLERASTYHIVIDIGLKLVFLNIYNMVSESDVFEKMELDPDFDLSTISEANFELLGMPIYDLEDTRDIIKNLKINILYNKKMKSYYIPGKMSIVFSKTPIKTSIFAGGIAGIKRTPGYIGTGKSFAGKIM